MKIVSTSYINTSEFTDPKQWLDRISFHSGILEQLAQQHTVESIEQINYSGKLERNGVVYHFLDFKKRKLYFPWRLHRYIKKLAPDVILVNGLIFPLQVIQLRLLIPKKTKIIIQNHAEKPYKGFRKFLQSRADRCADAYLFASHRAGMDWVNRGIIANDKKIMEIMEASSVFGPMDRQTARIKTKAEGDPVFLWVGRLDSNKDPLTVVKAFLKFVKYQPSAKLYMIYQTEELLPQIQAMIQLQGGDNPSIKLVGVVRHAQLGEWYNAADFIISGSHYEGSGIAVCEAMSCGCIPVLTTIDSFRAMTSQGKCGLFYEAGNSKDLLASLLQSLELDIEKERIKVVEQFRNELSFEAIAKKISRVIDLFK